MPELTQEQRAELRAKAQAAENDHPDAHESYSRGWRAAGSKWDAFHQSIRPRAVLALLDALEKYDPRPVESMTCDECIEELERRGWQYYAERGAGWIRKQGEYIDVVGGGVSRYRPAVTRARHFDAEETLREKCDDCDADTLAGLTYPLTNGQG